MFTDKGGKIMKSLRHFLCAALCLCLLLGIFAVQAGAAAPTVKVEMGAPYLYAVKGKNPASVAYGTATGAESRMTVSQSGSTISIKETENNKLYELGYVPIVTSLTVPAETTLYVTLRFDLRGAKNGTGSAQETVELFDFGSADNSSSITFNTTAQSSSYTKARAGNTGSSVSTSYTATVAYANTGTAEKTVFRYFGFFAGVHYGSTKNHRLEASCTVTAVGAVKSGSETPAFLFDKSLAGANMQNRSVAQAAAMSKDLFLPDADWDSLSAAQKEVFESQFQGSTSSQSMLKDAWDNQRLFTEMPAENTLRIASGNTSTTSLGRYAYIPFKVLLTVPADTTRTFCLSFSISYTRNTGSGAGFFAELIEGAVPDSFNTAASADRTGNTKLRVYSESGGSDTVHSGTVEIPVTLTNTTDSDKTYTQSYVFFAGHRQVGAYTPKPDFKLELSTVGYSHYNDTYAVTAVAKNCTVTAPATVTGLSALSATVMANTGYSLPTAVTVTVGGSTLAASKYTYKNGKIEIPAGYIKGAVVITASAVPKSYTVQFDANYTGGTNPASKTVTYNDTYGTLPTLTRTGYTFAGWYRPTLSGTVRVTSGTKMTVAGGHTLYAHWNADTYTVTLVGGGGKGTALTAYTYGVGATLPTDWTKQCAAFAGWYTAQEGGTAVTAIPAAALGDQIYYARWSDAHTEVTDAAVAPTCTKTGLTAGKHCAVCKTVLVAQTAVAALGHTEVTDAAVAPTLVKTGLGEGKHCAACGEILVPQQTLDRLPVPVRHNCAFGSDLSMLYAVPKDALAGCTDISLTVEQAQFAGNTAVGTESVTLFPTETVIDGAAYYRFDFDAVGAAELGDSLTATLHFTLDGTAYSRTADTYSLRQYAEERLRQTASEAYRVLMADFLRYGAATQTYLGYRTDALADADIGMAADARTASLFVRAADALADGDGGEYPAAVTQAAFTFGDRVSLWVATDIGRGSDLSGTALRIGYTDCKGNARVRYVNGADFVYSESAGGYTACFDGLKASEFGSALTLTLTKDGTAVSAAVSYSLAEFAADCLAAGADGKLSNLLEKTLLYAESAKNYFATKANEDTED